jgi:uncharacterized protein YutE (UPF0331/DUF86 family)
MYFVDRKQIQKTTENMDALLDILKEQSFTTQLEWFARERILHVLIESTLDVGNMMIDGFIMRDPGSYEDIIDILIDEKVIPKEQEEAYKGFIGLRKDIVIDYLAVDQVKIDKQLKESLPALTEFSTHIQHYLENELGVANAFLKE